MIIFDLDGTLYQTHETCLPAIYEVCSRYGITLSAEEEKYLMCTTVRALLNKVAPDMPLPQQKNFEQDVKFKEIEMVKSKGALFEHIKELLSSLYNRGIELAICGMGSREYIDTVLERCDIRSYFKYVFHRVDGVTKGERLKKLMKDAGISADDCIMIGDSITDIQAAQDNNIPCICVTYGYGTEEVIKADAVAENVNELGSLIDQFLLYQKIVKDIKSLRNPMLIGVNGVDTSGKTIFTNKLSDYLIRRGFSIELIHIDDFHNPREIRGKDDSAQGYIDNAFDLPKLSNLLKTLKNGPTDIQMNLLDLDENTFTKKTHFITNDHTVMILEGVMLYRPPLNELFDYKIFLDISFDEVLRRAEIRDVPKYGEAFLQRYIDKYIPAQKMYLEKFSPKEQSDFVIDNNNPLHPVEIKADI